jgi:hypothetical protein
VLTSRARATALVLWVVATGVLVGCDDSSPESREVSPSVTVVPLPPYEKAPVPEGFEKRSLVPGLWRLQAVEDDDRTIVVRVATGGCLKFDHMQIDASGPASLTLTAINEAWVPTGGASCTMELGVDAYRLVLPDKLAGRRIDGECESGDDTPQQRQCAAVEQVIG